MNKPVYNIEEYIYMTLGLCGTMPSTWRRGAVKMKTPFSDSYLARECNRLKAEGLVKVDNATKQVYLKPNGIRELAKRDREMMLHYMMISKGHNFSAIKERFVDSGRGMMFLSAAGVMVDGVKTRHKENQLGFSREEDKLLEATIGIEGAPVTGPDGKYKPFMKILGDNSQGFSYYSSSLIKRDETFGGHRSKFNLAKFNGCLFGPGGVTPVYVDPGHKSDTPFGQEEAAVGVMWQAWMRVSESRREKKNTCIFLVTGEEEIIKGLDVSGLEEVYDSRVVVPIADSDTLKQTDGEYILGLYEVENITERVKSSLYYKEERRERSDGEIEGIASWEFITSDFSKIKDIKKERVAHVICYPWQVDIIKKLAPDTSIKCMVLSDSKLKELNNLIRR